MNHNTLPRHGNPADDLRVLKLVIAKENILLGISIVGAKLPSNTVSLNWSGGGVYTHTAELVPYPTMVFDPVLGKDLVTRLLVVLSQ